MKEDQSNLARRFQPDAPVEVTTEKIANFCTAVGDLNPLYLDPVAAAAGPYRRNHRAALVRRIDSTR